MSIEADALARGVLGTSVPAVPDMLRAARAGRAAAALASSTQAPQLASATTVGIQRVIASATLGQWWAPWEFAGAMATLEIPTVGISVGDLIGAITGPGSDWRSIASRVAEVAFDALGNVLEAITSVPVIGWVVDVVVGLARIVYQLADAERAAAEADRMAGRVEPPIPAADVDAAFAQAVEMLVQSTADITRLWLPPDLGDYRSTLPRDRAYSCDLTTVCEETGGKKSRTVCGRLLSPSRPPWMPGADSMPMLDWLAASPAGFGVPFGLHGTQATGDLGRSLAFDWLIWPGGRTLNTGEWYPQTMAAVRAAESLCWGRGPMALRVDAGRIETAWRRWAANIATPGRYCRDTLQPGTRDRFRIRVQELFGVGATWGPEQAWNGSPVAAQAQALAARQTWLAQTTAAMYAGSVAPSLVQLVEQTRRGLLDRREVVCALRADDIADPELRAEVEQRKAAFGVSCYAAANVSAAFASGPTGLGPSLGEMPPLPKPTRAPVNASGESSGAALGLALGVAAAAGLAYWLSRPRAR